MDLETKQRTQPMLCKDALKLLARISEQGLHVFCKQCRCEHIVSWDQLHQWEQEVRDGFAGSFVVQ